MKNEPNQTTCDVCGMPLQFPDTACQKCSGLQAVETEVASPVTLINKNVPMPGEVNEQTETPVEPGKISVLFPDGTKKTYDDAQMLKEAIIIGEVEKGYKACLTGGTGDWLSVEQVADSVFTLKALYSPLWAYVGKGFEYGVIAGICLKALDTTVMLFVADPSSKLGLGFLLVVGSLFAIRWVKFAPILAIFLCFQMGIHVNLFMTFLTTMLVGAFFGGPLGALIGSIVGHFRKNSLPKAPDREPEGMSPYLWGMLVPALFLGAAVSLYLFWLVPKLAEWLAS